MKMKVICIQMIWLFLFGICFFPEANGAEIVIHELHFFGYYYGGDHGGVFYIDDKPITLEKFETKRLRFKQFYGGEHIGTNIMELEVEVANTSNKKINKLELTMTITPKIANLIFIKNTPDEAIDEEATEGAGKWDKVITIEKKKLDGIKPNSTEKIIFKKIQLKKIIDDYYNQQKWPLELKFTIKVDSEFKSESMIKKLSIPLPPY